jgi:hypothetical protein
VLYDIAVEKYRWFVKTHSMNNARMNANVKCGI